MPSTPKVTNLRCPACRVVTVCMAWFGAEGNGLGRSRLGSSLARRLFLWLMTKINFLQAGELFERSVVRGQQGLFPFSIYRVRKTPALANQTEPYCFCNIRIRATSDTTAQAPSRMIKGR